jgi:hypothetical protein
MNKSKNNAQGSSQSEEDALREAIQVATAEKMKEPNKDAFANLKLGGEVKILGYRVLHIFCVFLVCVRVWEWVEDSDFWKYAFIFLISFLSWWNPHLILG